mmetsp:Transcript_46039/g.84409  ORF Transcript_46039/g.84409 Transcript_46039/m.84409 type:complete len:235 (+) Transcript_46039:132-836(+)
MPAWQVLVKFLVAAASLLPSGGAGEELQLRRPPINGIQNSSLIGLEIDLLLRAIGSNALLLHELQDAMPLRHRSTTAAQLALMQTSSTASLLHRDILLLRASLVRGDPLPQDKQDALEQCVIQASGAAASLEQEIQSLARIARQEYKQAHTGNFLSVSVITKTAAPSKAAATPKPQPKKQVPFQLGLARRITLNGVLPWHHALVMWMGMYLCANLCIILFFACILPRKTRKPRG